MISDDYIRNKEEDHFILFKYDLYKIVNLALLAFTNGFIVM